MECVELQTRKQVAGVCLVLVSVLVFGADGSLCWSGAVLAAGLCACFFAGLGAGASCLKILVVLGAGLVLWWWWGLWKVSAWSGGVFLFIWCKSAGIGLALVSGAPFLVLKTVLHKTS